MKWNVSSVSVFIMLLISFTSCVKEVMEDPTFQPPYQDSRLRFIGDYHVTNLDNDSVYYMSISLPENQTSDSIRFINFGNQFPIFESRFHLVGGSYLSYLGFSIYDNSGNKWYISNFAEATGVYPPNVLLEGKILFHYKISNMAYYDQDSVPFFEGTFRHLATKLK